MDVRDILPGIIGSFVGVMGWLLVGIYIQRRQFMRQARNAAKAVFFELDVNRSTIEVAREHGLFADLDRSSFERLLPELATLLAAPELRMVVDAYMTHAGYRQLASRHDLPSEVRRVALGAFVQAHGRAIATLRSCAFTSAETRAIEGQGAGGKGHDRAPERIGGACEAVTEGEHQRVMGALSEIITRAEWDRLAEIVNDDALFEYPQSGERFRGLANIRATFEEYPNLGSGTSELEEIIGDDAYALTPTYTVIRVEGTGLKGTAVIRIRYPDGSPWWGINLFELRDGRLSRMRVFFAPDFEAPDWRAPYREAP